MGGAPPRPSHPLFRGCADGGGRIQNPPNSTPSRVITFPSTRWTFTICPATYAIIQTPVRVHAPPSVEAQAALDAFSQQDPAGSEAAQSCCLNMLGD